MIRGVALIAAGFVWLWLCAPTYATVGHPVLTIFFVAALLIGVVMVALGFFMLTVRREVKS